MKSIKSKIWFWLKQCLFFLPDELYLKLYYFLIFKKRLNLDAPKTFNEKIQYFKLFYHDDRYIKLVDKYEVREYVKQTIGEEYLIPLIGVYNSFDEIEISKLPNKFVIKCTHDSGGVYICKDRDSFPYQVVRRRFRKLLKTNYYHIAREWPYKFVKPRIIIEEYLEDASEKVIKDYKFFCFSGVVKALYIASDRNVDTRFDYYDREFNHLALTQHYSNTRNMIKKPQAYEEMLTLAEKLGNLDFPHVRVDFYYVNGRIYFGEMTFFHLGGMVPFEPEEWDETFGEWLTLPDRHI